MSARVNSARRLLAQFHHEDSGQDTIEYAMLAFLLGLAAVVGERAVASSINTVFIALGSKMSVQGV